MTAHAFAVRSRGPWLPSAAMISAKLLELRRRRVLMAVIVLFTVGLPVIIFGFRLGFHLADPKAYGPAGSPSLFPSVSDLLNEFGFIVAAALGATAGTTDLTDGMFRHLVITGRSRLGLYLSRIPAGLSIILSLAGLAFAIICLVTCFLGTPSSAVLHLNGVAIPAYLDQAQLHAWLLSHQQQTQILLLGGGPHSPIATPSLISHQLGSAYDTYSVAEAAQVNPSVTGMIDAGLWIELDLLIGFVVGLGIGSLMGQRTVPIILLTFLQVFIAPAFATHVLPYFINGERLLVGVAMDQLQPATLTGGFTFRPGAGGAGAPHPALLIPPMPTWAMWSVIAGWIIGWSVIGAWRMATRDA